MTIKEIQEEIVDEFALFDDWMDRYQHLIALGKSIDKIDDKYKTADYTIKGCQSKVWLYAEKKDNRIVFSADSDAILTKGIIGLLLRVYSNQPAEEILKSDTDFIDEIGLKEHLSPTRANGLVSMIKQIKLFAIALQSN
ncbi:SufE family protein [Flavobacteriaceae bacterium F08102]|nr:SufE family protein [Flavobacteriaceae bacterium F08102]